MRPGLQFIYFVLAFFGIFIFPLLTFLRLGRLLRKVDRMAEALRRAGVDVDDK